VSLSGTPWKHSIRYHDIQPELILTAEVEDLWRDRSRAVFGENSLDGFTLTANGELTRGAHLDGLFRFFQAPKPQA